MLSRLAWIGAGLAAGESAAVVPVRPGSSSGASAVGWGACRSGACRGRAGRDGWRRRRLPAAAAGQLGARGVAAAFGCAAGRRGRLGRCAARGDRRGNGLGDLFLQRAARGLAGHQVGDHVADLGKPPHRLGVPGGQQVEAALGAIMDGGGPHGRLVEHLLGLSLGRGERGLRFLGGLADGPLALDAGRVAQLLRLGTGAGDGVLRLLLGRGQHSLGLLAGLGAVPFRFLLGIVALLVDLVLGAYPLRLGLVLGELEDLADPLADLLVGRLVAQILAGRGQLQAGPFCVVHGTREPLFQIADLASGAGDEFVHLAAAVAAHLDFEGVFLSQVWHQVCIVSHRGTREVSQAVPSCAPRGHGRGRLGGGRRRSRPDGRVVRGRLKPDRAGTGRAGKAGSSHRRGSGHDSCPDYALAQPKRTIIPVYPNRRA